MALNESRFDVVRIDADTRTINSQSIEVIQTDDNNNVEVARGDVAITDGGSGFAIGCLYMNTSGGAGSILYLNEGSTTSCNFDAINPNASGGGGGLGLDEAYSINSDVTVDEGASTWTDSSTGALNTLELVKDGAGSGNLLDLSLDAAATGNALALDMNLGIAATGILIDNGGTARTGADILVTDDSTGNHSVIDINSSGSGASIGLDWTGSNAGSPGGSAVSLTFDNADNLDTEGVLITRGTGVRTASALSIVDTSTGSDDLINIDIGGVFTGDAIDITTSAAATGNALFVNLDSAVAMTAIHVEGSGVRTQPFIELVTDATGAADLIDISVDGAVTGDAIDIDLNLGLACRAMYIDGGAGTRTANLIDILHDGDGNVDAIGIIASNTGSGHVLDINMTGINSGNAIDIVYSAASTGDAVNLDMTSAVAGSALTIVGAGARTDDLIKIDDASTGSGSIFDINMTGIYTGTIFDLSYAAAATGDAMVLNMTNAVAAKAMLLTGAGARTDDMFEINDASTGSGHGMDWNYSGVYTGNCLDITYSASAATGNAIDLNMGTNVAGMAISVSSAATGTSGEGACFDVEHTGDLGAGADVVTIHSTGNISSTSNLLALEQDTGAGTAGANALYINATGTNVEAIKVDAGTVTFDETLTVTGLITATAGIDAKVIFAATETIAAGGTTTALDLTKFAHDVDADAGGDIFTLANGTVGQITSVVLKTATGVATVTPATFLGGTSVTLNAAGDSVTFCYTANGWFVVGGNSYTVI